MIKWDTSDSLFSLTHLDGRNGQKLTGLRPYFSEFAWIEKRLSVMIDYVVSLYEFLESSPISSTDKQNIISIAQNFTLADAHDITRKETKTNHDIKAIEQFIVTSLQKRNLAVFIPYINLGIGSEDINSIAFGRLMGECRDSVLFPCLQKIALVLTVLAQAEKNRTMVARTHAQAANITTFGKEVANFLLRLCDEVEIFTSSKFSVKCTGEVGSLQGFLAVDSSRDWLGFTDKFIRSYDLTPTHAATQIAPYDSLVRFLQSLERINSILLDYVKNMWLYVLVGYVRVIKVETEVGSAGMPHKVNPIYFEGAEGGLEMTNGILETLSRTLPVNRLQRDFSDSTTRRNISMPIGLSVLSYQSIVEGIKRLSVEREVIASSLDRHQEVYLELVKVFCLRHGMNTIYDWLKDKTRGKTIDGAQLRQLIGELPLKVKEKQALQTMLGEVNPYPAKIVDEAVVKARKIFYL